MSPFIYIGIYLLVGFVCTAIFHFLDVRRDLKNGITHPDELQFSGLCVSVVLWPLLLVIIIFEGFGAKVNKIFIWAANKTIKK